MSTHPSNSSRSPIHPLSPSAVLLDLDGTISNSGPSIIAALSETLSHFDYAIPSEAELLRFVGPPIRDGFRDLAGVPEEEIEVLVADYRARYNDTMLDAPLYPGMAEFIHALHEREVPLALATSKRRSLALTVLQHEGLTPYFTAICGAFEDESRAEKPDIIADALTGLRGHGADISRAIMVGDRHHDIQGAIANGLAAILVTWGYGGYGEDNGAVAVANDVAELAVLLSPGPSDTPFAGEATFSAD